MYIDFQAYGTGFLELDKMHKKLCAGDQFVIALRSESDHENSMKDYGAKIGGKKKRNLAEAVFHLYGWGNYDNDQYGLKLSEFIERLKGSLDKHENENQSQQHSLLDGIQSSEFDQSSGEDSQEESDSSSCPEKEIKSMSSPCEITLLDENMLKYVPLQVSCGPNHTCVLAIEEQVYLQTLKQMKKLDANREREHSRILKGWTQRKLNPLLEKTKVFTAGLDIGGKEIVNLIANQIEEHKKQVKREKHHDKHELLDMLELHKKIFPKYYIKKKNIEDYR